MSRLGITVVVNKAKVEKGKYKNKYFVSQVT